MKKIAGVISAFVLVVGTVSPVWAAGNNCGNDTTGPISVNYCNVTNTSSVTVTNVNKADIVNNISARSNSGGNSASMNTLGGSITTGNASLNGTVSNVANINTTTVSGGPAASGNAGVNATTGPESDNRVTINNTQAVAVINTNEARVRNQIEAVSDSGSNFANTNTGAAEIHTGNAALSFGLENHLNDSATGISAGAGGTGSNSGGNQTTGPFSYNEINVTNVSQANVLNDNDLRLNNLVSLLSRSGGNSASTNTLGGEITTGGSTSNLVVDNEGNIATTTIQMAMGGFSNIGGNEITGPLSDNRANLLNSLGINVDNLNDSTVNNNVSDIADSGDNFADTNTGQGSISSGLTQLIKTIMNHLNDSLTAIQQ